MPLERRTLLKCLALGGLATAALGNARLATAQALLGARLPSPAPTLILVDAAASAFLAGVATALAAEQVEVRGCGLGLDFLLDLEGRLHSGQSQRVIGLVDDASAVLIVDQARGAGARLQWLGQHHISAEAARHRALGATAADAHARQLARRLAACGSGCARWAVTLGHALATPGAGDLGPATPLVDRPAPLTGHFVSFAIET